MSAEISEGGQVTHEEDEEDDRVLRRGQVEVLLKTSCFGISKRSESKSEDQAEHATQCWLGRGKTGRRVPR